MKTVIFYHKSDLDGVCSAAIARMWAFACGETPVELVGVDYGDRPKWSMVGPQTNVWVVDFCFEKAEMLHLREEARTVYWCDHHQTAIEKMGADAGRFAGLRKVGTAGCELTWEAAWDVFMAAHTQDSEHFMPMLMPDVVRLLGRYDVWDHADQDVVPFQYGMRSKPWAMDPGSMWWPMLLSDATYASEVIKDTVPKGQAVLDYLKISRKQSGQGSVYLDRIDDQLFLCGNTSVEVLRECVADYQDAYEVLGVMGWAYKPGKGFVVSLRAVGDIDVSSIAAKRGGGGHRGAAGFTIQEQIGIKGVPGESDTESVLRRAMA